MAKKKLPRTQHPTPTKAAKAAKALPSGTPVLGSIPIGLEKRILIDRQIPSGLQPVFSNHFVVHHDEGLFRLFFFNITPPLIPTDDLDEARRQLEALETLPAKCVAEVIMSSEHLGEVIKALISNFQRSQQKATADTGGHKLNGGNRGTATK